MRRARARFDDGSDVDMTPMLDIVFILLIFFIVTATFLDEKAIEVAVPPASDEPPPSNAKRAITVYVDADNQCSVDSERVTCDRVPVSVERLLSDKPGANIILRINKASDTEVMVDLKNEFDSTGQTVVIEAVETS